MIAGSYECRLIGQGENSFEGNNGTNIVSVHESVKALTDQSLKYNWVGAVDMDIW